MSTRTVTLFLAAAAAALAAAATGSLSFTDDASTVHSGPADDRVPHGTLIAGQARQVLPKLTVAPTGPMTGYDRDCGKTDACVFGPAWSDDVDVDDGHNGCDTRKDVLGRDLTPATIRFKHGTRSCKVLAGALDDPYTGRTLDFSVDDPTAIQIDHVISLGQAWRSGARDWPAVKRQRFANDPINLLAVDGPTNQEKSDKPLGEWLPPNRGYLCSLGRITVTTSHRYGLTITPTQRDALDDALKTCDEPRPSSREGGGSR